MNLRSFLQLSIVAVAFTACSSDDDTISSIIDTPDTSLDITETYTFVRPSFIGMGSVVVISIMVLSRLR